MITQRHMIKLEEKLKQLQANCYMLQLYMETRGKTFSDNFWSFGWPWLGTHFYKMTPTALDYHSISYGAHVQCAPFDTVRITSIRRTNRRFSVKLANYREESVIYGVKNLRYTGVRNTLRPLRSKKERTAGNCN
ncbi:hypothetical protein TNCV_4173491 [Trichonephila clavipes]|nr:hypothetical protein TNCV_4173491 [Trichonephila clavipes]